MYKDPYINMIATLIKKIEVVSPKDRIIIVNKIDFAEVEYKLYPYSKSTHYIAPNLTTYKIHNTNYYIMYEDE